MEVTPKLKFLIHIYAPVMLVSGEPQMYRFTGYLIDVERGRHLATLGWEMGGIRKSTVRATNIGIVCGNETAHTPPIRLPDTYAPGYRKAFRTIAKLALAMTLGVLPLVDAREDEILILPMMPTMRRN